MPALELLVPDLIVVACVLLIEQEGCEDRVRCVRLRCSAEDSLHWSQSSKVFNLTPHHLRFDVSHSMRFCALDVCVHKFCKEFVLTLLSGFCRDDRNQCLFLRCGRIPSGCLPVSRQLLLDSCRICLSERCGICGQNHLAESPALVSIVLRPSKSAGLLIRRVCRFSCVCRIVLAAVYLTA